MKALSPTEYAVLSALATQLQAEQVWSIASGDAGSDVNGWLGNTLSDTVRSPQVVALREQVRQILGSNVTPDAAAMFKYYRSLVDGAPVPLPATIAPVVWMDGRLQAYSDAGGTLPVSSGLIRRINEAGGTAWASESDSQRPSRDLGIRCDIVPSGAGFGQLLRAAQSVTLNSWTMVAQYVCRYDSGSNMGLGATSATNLGLFCGSTGVGVFTGSPISFAGIAAPRGQKCTFVARGRVADVTAALRSNGITQFDSVATALGGGTTGANGWRIAPNFSNMNGLQGSVNQFLVIPRAVTDTEVAQLLAWGDSLASTDAFPVGASLVGLCGDSIVQGVGIIPSQAWAWLMLNNLRTGSFPTVEECNVAVAGSGVGPSMYANLTPFYSTSRAKNICLLAAGTNDLANGNGAAATIAAYFAACDANRALGAKVVACTILPRSNAMIVSQGTFNADRATVNAAIIANSSHYDALANVAAVATMGADGDSNNATNYQADLIHPTAIGHGLIEPTYRAAVSSLL